MADDNKIRTSGFCKFNDIRVGECYKYNNDFGFKYCRFENEDSAYKHYLSHWKEGNDLWPAIPNGEYRWFYSWPRTCVAEGIETQPSWAHVADLEAELIPRWDYVPTGPYPHDDNDFDVYDYVVKEIHLFPEAPYYAIIVKDYLENGESKTTYFALNSESKWKAGIEQLFEFEEEDVTGKVYGYHVDRVAKVKMVIE